ncbi:TenA family transcriptional regulator [Alkalimonas amylolytica]|uniref:Pyrroloquinoline quinone (PQQ) biosynthesis protein C n=1 Tax=Alkalimonas amylolytica TaxID=152573 RepID=A0A1H4AWS1_ALKAM|nr:iron-containing redox enzyme family protein [Alkalimonas amylolytica]SEA40102.1 Pyrroloquinoline quinone (PQQ) biosynthesis protein C [Alkalimonas amylolytica]
MTNNAIKLDQAIQMLSDKLYNHSFLVRCRQGSISLSELKAFLLQHGLYSTYFTRYLCAMMASLPANSQVLALAENLFEELGLAPDSPTPHHVIYKNMLDTFSIALDSAKINQETQALIDCMFKHCREQNPALGLGALCIGAEAIVPALYSSLVAGFRHHGISDEAIQFFILHIECDDGHAETLHEIMLDISGENELQLENMIKAGEELINARLNFFSALEHQPARIASENTENVAFS